MCQGSCHASSTIGYWFFVGGIASMVIHHVYFKVNSATNWVALFVAQYIGDVIWIAMESTLGHFRSILFFDFVGCIHTRLV